MTTSSNTFPPLVARFARENTGHAALSFLGRVTTSGELEERSSRLASALRSAGAVHGTRIAYLGKNNDRFFELLIAGTKAGAVLVPVGWRLSPLEVSTILDDAEAELLFLDATGLATFLAARPEMVSSPLIVTIDVTYPDFASYDWFIESGSNSLEAAWASGTEDAFLQLYTSGTTGKPKGVVLCQRNFFSMRVHAEPGEPTSWDQWEPDDIALVAMPIAHIGGAGLGMLALFFGVTCVIAAEFNPGEILDFIERDRVNRIFLVPSAIRIILEDPRARTTDFSRLRSIVYGSSPIPLELLREAVEVFGCGFVQTYGMTETTGTIVCLPETDHSLEGTPRMRSAGRPMDGVEIVIVDDTGKPAPMGAVGEIIVRSPANMVEYWKQPEETRAAVSADGWLRTGDAGYFDADGYVYLHDRVKDMIITGGENVYPAEVENAIFGHAAVRDVAVIGVPHERWGEAVKAVVVLREGMQCTEADILAWARTRIASFKVPKSVDFQLDLPRNATGKVLRRMLRQPYWDSAAATK